MYALELTASVSSGRNIRLDEDVTLALGSRVRLLVLSADDNDDLTDPLWLKAVSSNPAFEFLNDPREDIYTLDDGAELSRGEKS